MVQEAGPPPSRAAAPPPAPPWRSAPPTCGSSASTTPTWARRTSIVLSGTTSQVQYVYKVLEILSCTVLMRSDNFAKFKIFFTKCRMYLVNLTFLIRYLSTVSKGLCHKIKIKIYFILCQERKGASGGTLRLSSAFSLSQTRTSEIQYRKKIYD